MDLIHQITYKFKLQFITSDRVQSSIKLPLQDYIYLNLKIHACK